MQIHELNNFQGTPTSSDYLPIDNGSDTMKIPAIDLGITTAMTQAEATAGTSTAKRVITPKVLKDSVKAISPVPDAMTSSEAQDGIVTDTRVISPKVLKDAILEIAGTSIDPIVEQGSKNGWDWRKYESGRYEAWYSGSVTMAITGVIGSIYQSSSNSTLSIPSEIGALSVIYGGVTLHINTYGVWSYVIAMSTSSISYRGFSAASRVSASYDVRAYIYGRWQ